MAKTTQWLNGSLPEVVAASVLRVADLLHVSSEVPVSKQQVAY